MAISFFPHAGADVSFQRRTADADVSFQRRNADAEVKLHVMWRCSSKHEDVQVFFFSIQMRPCVLLKCYDVGCN